jgi:hypothetical protein
MGCGASGAETTAQGQAAGFSSLLNANYAQNFGAESGILKNLTNTLTPIAEAGPDQEGFGANEKAALNTQAREGVGTNYAHAKQALDTTLSARGGGDEELPSGAADQLHASLATSAAKESSDQQLGITEADYSTGRANYSNAVSGLEGVAGEYNPNATAGAANNANQTSFSDASQINQENNAWQGQVAGLVGGLGAAAIGTMGPKKP